MDMPSQCSLASRTTNWKFVVDEAGRSCQPRRYIEKEGFCVILKKMTSDSGTRGVPIERGWWASEYMGDDRDVYLDHEVKSEVARLWRYGFRLMFHYKSYVCI
jgi:hypothetical protein